MKRLSILLLLGLFCLAGCGDYIEPERRQLITALGVDATDGGIRLTAESLDNGVSAGGEAKTRLAYGIGAGMEEALTDLENGSFGKVLLSQCPILLVSNRLNADQRQSVWEFCLNDHFISPAVEISSCDNAADLLGATENNDRITGYELLELLRRAETVQGIIHTVHLPQVLERTDRYCLPFTALQNGDFTITGVSLFGDHAYRETLTLTEGQLLFALMGRFSKGKILVGETQMNVVYCKVGHIKDGALPVCFGVRQEPLPDTKQTLEAALDRLISTDYYRSFFKERQMERLCVRYTVIPQ